MYAHHQPWEVSSPLHAKRADEAVENCCDEDYDGCYIVKVVQTPLESGVVQISTSYMQMHSANRQTHKKRLYHIFLHKSIMTNNIKEKKHALFHNFHRQTAV